MLTCSYLSHTQRSFLAALLWYFTILFLLQFFGPLDERRSTKGEKRLVSTADWRKDSRCLPEWPPNSFAQWKAVNSGVRHPPRRDAIDIAQLRVELLAISKSRFGQSQSCSLLSVSFCSSDKPVPCDGANIKDWVVQLDNIDELVHTREELRAYSPNPSRFNESPYNSRSYVSPRSVHQTLSRCALTPFKVHIYSFSHITCASLGPVQRQR
jgi:hypothetical protein